MPNQKAVARGAKSAAKRSASEGIPPVNAAQAAAAWSGGSGSGGGSGGGGGSGREAKKPRSSGQETSPASRSKREKVNPPKKSVRSHSQLKYKSGRKGRKHK